MAIFLSPACTAFSVGMADAAFTALFVQGAAFFFLDLLRNTEGKLKQNDFSLPGGRGFHMCEREDETPLVGKKVLTGGCWGGGRGPHE